MEVIVNYFPELLMVLGIAALIIEIVLLGFSTFLLLFVGIALFCTGLAMKFGLLDATLYNATWLSSALTCILALFLWRPLKSLQNKPANNDLLKSDFAKITFVLTGDVNETSDNVLHTYSGIQWKVRSKYSLSKGQTVQVVHNDVGVLWVEAVE